MSEGKRWIVRDATGRIFGPLSTEKVLSEIDRGFFQGEEEIALYPSGKWISISKSPEFYDRLLDALSAEVESDSIEGPLAKKQAPLPDPTKTQQKMDAQDPTSGIQTASATLKDESYGSFPVSSGENVSDDSEIIELANLEEIRKRLMRGSRFPFLFVLIGAGLGVALVTYLFWDSGANQRRIRLLHMTTSNARIDNQNAKEKFSRALKAFQTDTFAGYQRAQNELVELGQSAYLRVEDSRERASVMQLLCLTYRELWPYSFQDANDIKAVGVATRFAKKLDPGGIHGSVCEIVQLIVNSRILEAQNKAENTLEEEGQAPVVFEIRGDLYFSAREYSNAASYFVQARSLYANWQKTWIQEARAKAAIRQINEAIALYQSVLEKNPNHIVARIELAIIFFKLVNQADRSFEMLSNAIGSGQRIPQDLEARANFTLAEIALKRGQKVKAKEYAEQALRLLPGDPQIRQIVRSLGIDPDVRTSGSSSTQLVYMGDQLMKGDDWLSAQAHFKAAFEADPTNGMAAVKAAKCLWKLNQIDDSIRWLQKAIKADSQLTIAYTELADYYAQRFNYYEANNVMRVIHRKQPDNYEVWRGLAVIEVRRNNFRGAISYAQRALKLYDSDIDTLNLLAKAYLGLREYQEASSYAQRAIEIDYNNTEAQGLVGKIKVGLYGIENAADYMRSLIAKYYIKKGQPVPFAAIEYRTALGEIYQMDDRHQQAFEVLKQAVELSPNNKQALVTLAISLRALGKGTEALELLLRAAELDVSDPNSIFLAGQIYFDKGQLPEAKKQFERVLKMNERFPKARISLARVALKSGDAEGALKLAREEGTNNPELGEANVVAAEAFYSLGQYGNAGAEYQLAVGKGVATTEIFIRAARCYRRAGALDSAVSLLRRAETLESGHPEIYKEQGAVFQTSGLSEEAVKAYEIYLRLAPGASDRFEIEKRISKIQSGDLTLDDK